MSTKVSQTCENCGHHELTKFIDKPAHQLLHCTKCDLFQKGVLESNLVYEEDYHQDYARRLNSKKATAKIRLGSIKPYLNSQVQEVGTPLSTGSEISTDAGNSQNPSSTSNISSQLTLTNSRLRMLDIGCSVGATVSAASEMGWDASGVDVSQRAIEACQERGLDCRLIDGVELPFEDETFDLVTNWHVIEHVKDVHETLAEWQRVLKPGGVMILETPDARYLKARLLGTRYKKFWPSEHLYTFNRSNLESILETGGFEILPNRLIGSWTTLSPALTTYAMGYRSFRTVCRRFRMCKSLEICCRKPVRQCPNSSHELSCG